ncbi:carboxypeptidase-like regulatory domain-containing protein [Sphingobacterium sp. lm-10]|uniref:carboxypeptidase-like regulatory domain-containing protein n=1 Tax=Sphingobacterium sp. lm-10 TaxID=2944904 RepID=UPI0020217CE0|nr:carboxypeptidase-like regulatory domain-containing protein [Sphingobacterium sp. lm-10]MCL7987041.1 carboxypeptidase-like regulatory domain-containing protein [Sphingobacterium sp. lm-10]
MRQTLLSITVLAILFLTSGLSSFGQELKGVVYDLQNSQKLRGILVKNLNNNKQAETDSEGNFTIDAKANDYLRLSGGGYESDTIFIYEQALRRVYLVRDQETLVINEVYVTRLSDSRLASEIARAKNDGQAAEASQQRGGLRVSPSRLFGRRGKQARSNLDVLIAERDNRQVDRVFTNQLIRSMTPLTDDEIPLFREGYRPSLSFIESATPEDLRAYISDSYTKYRKEKP